MYATARDWARFGQLYLQDGVWNGERLLPDGWVEYTRSPAASSGGLYGAHVWLDVPGDEREGDAALPAGTFHAAGHEGQFVTVVPAHGLVIVRLGCTRDRGAWDHTAFVTRVVEGAGRR